jgi:hypothetical protein
MMRACIISCMVASGGDCVELWFVLLSFLLRNETWLILEFMFIRF